MLIKSTVSGSLDGRLDHQALLHLLGFKSSREEQKSEKERAHQDCVCVLKYPVERDKDRGM